MENTVSDYMIVVTTDRSLPLCVYITSVCQYVSVNNVMTMTEPTYMEKTKAHPQILLSYDRALQQISL